MKIGGPIEAKHVRVRPRFDDWISADENRRPH